MKDAFKAIQYEDRCLGPGGYKCSCCGPAPKDRAKHRKMTRTRLKRQTQREIAEEME